MGFKEDRITVSLYCVTLGATAAVCLHAPSPARSLESFDMRAAAAANRSINKPNDLVLVYQVMYSCLIAPSVSDLLMQASLPLGICELILIS